jgi:exosortase/archaeosortase family protein
MISFVKKYFSLVLAIAAFWPVVKWYFLRASQSPEEMCGLFAILLAGFFVASRGKRPGPEFADQSLYAHTASVILCYALCYHYIPPLIRAAVAMTVITRIISSLFLKRKFHTGLWILLGLSLPIIPSLQFYLGYPLRTVVALLALPLIRLAGFAVIREGACFNFSGQLVWIDAPCSGIQMLWAGMLLAAGCSCFKNLNSFRTALLLAATFIMAILANSIRAATLFFTEAHIVEAPAWFHEGTGILTFMMLGAFILWAVNRAHFRKLLACI